VFKSSKELGGSYTVKLEGAKVTGYRTIFMGSFGDPILISQLPSLLEAVKAYVTQQHQHIQEKWKLGFHIYGHDQRSSSAGSCSSGPVEGEIFIVGEALAETQTLASSIASTARIACVHGPYKGQKATSGNFGMGIGGKLEIETGLCAEFSLYHLMALDEGAEEASEICHEGSEVGEWKGAEKLFKWEIAWLGTGDRIQPISPTTRTGENENEPEPKPLSLTQQDTTGSPLAPSCTLGDAAKIIRSKNAGPYEVTLDVLFDNKAVYDQIKKSGILQPQLIARLYNLPVEDIIYCNFFDQAMAFKATIPRMRDGKPAPSGGYMENDVHGSQKHMPLMNLKLELSV
ncbi:CAIB/BAIF family enzyme, partial [Lipomyces tetrasporus]